MAVLNVDVAERKMKKGVPLLARLGLISKGFVYVVLGVLAFMAAFRIGGKSGKDADTGGVLDSVNDSSVGNWLLPLLAAGLLCYSIWRFVEAARHIKDKVKKALRYLLSGLVYLSLAITAFKVAFSGSQKDGDNQQQIASELLSKPFGQWLLLIAALIIAGVGVYQMYYALSEKYKKHVQKMNLHTKASTVMLFAGKIGYLARGIVWLVIAYLMVQASRAASSAKAGDTGKAFATIEDSYMGVYLLAVLGMGLIAYGFFNFIRARYESLH